MLKWPPCLLPDWHATDTGGYFGNIWWGLLKPDVDFLITEIWTVKHNDTHTCIQALTLLRSYHKNQKDREKKKQCWGLLSVLLFEWFPEHVDLCWATQTAHSELLMKMKQNQMLEEIQTTQRVEMWNTATLRRVHLWFPLKSLTANKVWKSTCFL